MFKNGRRARGVSDVFVKVGWGGRSSRGARMTEHPRVLVEAARLLAGVVEERRGMQRRGFGASAREMDRAARELVEDQEQMAEMDALAR